MVSDGRKYTAVVNMADGIDLFMDSVRIADKTHLLDHASCQLEIVKLLSLLSIMCTKSKNIHWTIIFKNRRQGAAMVQTKYIMGN